MARDLSKTLPISSYCTHTLLHWSCPACPSCSCFILISRFSRPILLHEDPAALSLSVVVAHSDESRWGTKRLISTPDRSFVPPFIHGVTLSLHLIILVHPFSHATNNPRSYLTTFVGNRCVLQKQDSSYDVDALVAQKIISIFIISLKNAIDWLSLPSCRHKALYLSYLLLLGWTSAIQATSFSAGWSLPGPSSASLPSSSSSSTNHA